MGLQVSIEEKAKDVIQAKGNLITVSSVSIENCCVPVNEVMVRFRKPDEMSMFHCFNLGKITLYIDKKLDFKQNQVRIKPTGIGPFRTVRVEGVAFM